MQLGTKEWFRNVVGLSGTVEYYDGMIAKEGKSTQEICEEVFGKRAPGNYYAFKRCANENFKEYILFLFPLVYQRPWKRCGYIIPKEFAKALIADYIEGHAVDWTKFAAHACSRGFHKRKFVPYDLNEHRQGWSKLNFGYTVPRHFPCRVGRRFKQKATRLHVPIAFLDEDITASASGAQPVDVSCGVETSVVRVSSTI